MLEEFKAGGDIMWFLLLCAVAGLTFAIERVITLLLRTGGTRQFAKRLMKTVDQQGVQAGIELCAKTPSPVAKVLGAALEKAGQDRTLIENAVVQAGATELGFLDRFMPLIAGITTVAPFFGFLGTVTGMIGAFKAVAAVGEVDPTVVSSGIAEALITTKWGLIIAAPLSIVHIAFSMVVNGYLRQMESASSELVDYLTAKR
ncbi:MotA/TolQ/ExbB proton channel family protein [candidate division WOR-3 bacterium]|nr:MotA/TolQ/ExbB proton channel family protein [candidate division WOR-3 bacterium]